MAARHKVAAWALCTACMAVTQTSARAEAITLDQALERAARENPAVAASAADVDAAKGAVQGAGTRSYDPELGAAVGPAFGGSSTYLDFEVSLSQTFELGGKRAKRVAGAQARRTGAELRLDWTRTQLALQVRRSFFLAVVARERVVAARDGEVVAAEVAAASGERLRLGAGTQLELNVAAAGLGRARAERVAAERQYAQGRADLASVVGAAAAADLEPVGDLPSFSQVKLTEDAVVRRSLAARPDLGAVRQERVAAEADLALAHSLKTPDAALGVTYGHSGIEDSDTVMVGLTFTLPFFNRNQGGRTTARAQVTKARVVESAAAREAERTARTAYRSYRLALESVLSFDRDVVGKLGENLALARDSFASGKIGLLEFNIVRRELVETRFAYLNALVELVEARHALELAAGGNIE